MEQFVVAAQHSGTITHVHSLHLSSSAVDIAKEARNIVLVIVAGWIAVSTIGALRSSFQQRDR